jgi:hypothetical protein
MAEVNFAVGIRQRRRDENSLKFRAQGYS